MFSIRRFCFFAFLVHSSSLCSMLIFSVCICNCGWANKRRWGAEYRTECSGLWTVSSAEGFFYFFGCSFVRCSVVWSAEALKNNAVERNDFSRIKLKAKFSVHSRLSDATSASAPVLHCWTGSCRVQRPLFKPSMHDFLFCCFSLSVCPTSFYCCLPFVVRIQHSRLNSIWSFQFNADVGFLVSKSECRIRFLHELWICIRWKILVGECRKVHRCINA